MERRLTAGQEARGRGTHVQAFARGIHILKAFSRTTPTLTLPQIAEATQLDRAVVRRYLMTLQDLGYVGASGKGYSLRPRILEIGYGYLASAGLPEIVQPHLNRLSATVNESCAVTVQDDSDVVYIAVANTDRSFSIQLTVGNRLPAYCTAMGRILLAGQPKDEVQTQLRCVPLVRHTAHTIQDPDRITALIDRARSQGWAIGDEELEAGVHSVAVPIRDSTQQPIAAMSVSTPSVRVSNQTLKETILEKLRAARDSVEKDIVDVPVALSRNDAPVG
ncbi:IclR family transcriptional regulator domain-containing protein [Arthrobacter castelli]|uniref:IclR family transcriptional regulator domain-containing protein n=1 Tax=Arthrobacter castelli TaxID=271431 RepID=UPI00068600F8|nr:IclR family transcriptional regulator C-terminal domain-containing protein [Arthrobacter castelli]